MSDKDDKPDEPGTATDDATKASDGDGERMDLPKWNRARVKRKQPKGEEQDTFQAGVRKAGKTALTQAPVVIGLIVLVAGVIAGVVWYRGKAAEDRAVATRVLANATAAQARSRIEVVDPAESAKKLPPPNPVFPDEGARAQAVDDTLAQLDGELADSEAAQLAGLVEAGRLMQQGKFADAKAEYESFLSANPDHPLGFLANEGLALALEASGDIDGAVSILDTMAPDAGAFYRDQALYHKGRMLEGQGKSDEALAIYKTYVEEYPLEQDSLAKDAVMARLEELAPDLIPAEAKAPAGGLGGPGGMMGLPPGLGG
ncbi:MAG: YfgM family protein [Nannocystaceae bacterium]|nr:tetratricopeptide repeat protein [bacterium]